VDLLLQHRDPIRPVDRKLQRVLQRSMQHHRQSHHPVTVGHTTAEQAEQTGKFVPAVGTSCFDNHFGQPGKLVPRVTRIHQVQPAMNIRSGSGMSPHHHRRTTAAVAGFGNHPDFVGMDSIHHRFDRGSSHRRYSRQIHLEVQVDSMVRIHHLQDDAQWEQALAKHRQKHHKKSAARPNSEEKLTAEEELALGK